MIKKGFFNPKYEKIIIEEANRFTTLMADNSVDGLSKNKALYLKLSLAKSSIQRIVLPDGKDEYVLILNLFKDLYENLQLGSAINLNSYVINVIDMINTFCIINYNNSKHELIYWYKIFNGIGSLCKIESTIHNMVEYGAFMNENGDTFNPEVAFVSDRFINIFIEYPTIYKILGINDDMYTFIKSKYVNYEVSTIKSIDFIDIPTQIKDNKSIQCYIDSLNTNIGIVYHQKHYSHYSGYFADPIDKIISAIYDEYTISLSKGMTDLYEYYQLIYEILIGLSKLCKFNTNEKVNNTTPPKILNIIKLLFNILKCLCSEDNTYSLLNFIDMVYSLNKLANSDDPYIHNTNLKLTDIVIALISFIKNISRNNILDDIINLEKKYSSCVNVAVECYNYEICNNGENNKKEEK